MTYQPEKKGFDLFNKRKPLVYPEIPSGLLQKLQNVNLLYVGSALLQIATGLFAIALSILNMIQPLWAGAVMTILGSILTLGGCGLLYFTLKDRDSIERLVKLTIERVIRDHN